MEAERGGEVNREEYETMKRDMEELKEVLTAVQLDLEARQSDLVQRDSQLRDTNVQLVNSKARISVSYYDNSNTTVLMHILVIGAGGGEWAVKSEGE